MSQQSEHQTGTGLEDAVPIREISRLTGVNTVTLRAWERRYGLLRPSRTHKGHRLYSHTDITRVKEIQTWLARGLAISKVSAILSAQPDVRADVAIDSVWVDYLTQINTLLEAFKRAPLSRVFEELFALYPTEIIADNLLEPLVQSLSGEGVSKPSRLAFLTSVFQEQIYFGLARQRQVTRVLSALVLSLSPRDSSLMPMMLSYSLMVNHWRAEYLFSLPLDEAVIAAATLSPGLLILCGYQNLDAGELSSYLFQWCLKTTRPVLLVGPLADMYAAVCNDLNVQLCEKTQQGSSPLIYAVRSHQDALSWLNSFSQTQPKFLEPSEHD